MYGGRIYTVKWDAATAVTASIDVFEIGPAANKPVFIHEIRIWQVGAADVGDAQEEVLDVSVIRGLATSGSGGGTPTVAKRYNGDSAASFTSECRNTTLASAGTAEQEEGDGFNVRVPYIWTPTPEDRPFCSNGQTLIVVRLGAPADSIILNAALKVEEIG